MCCSPRCCFLCSRCGALTASWQLEGFYLFLLAGAFSTYLGRWFFLESVVRFGPSRASIFQITSPLFTALMAWGLLNEALQPLELGGMGLALGGLLLIVPGAASASGAGYCPGTKGLQPAAKLQAGADQDGCSSRRWCWASGVPSPIPWATSFAAQPFEAGTKPCWVRCSAPAPVPSLKAVATMPELVALILAAIVAIVSVSVTEIDTSAVSGSGSKGPDAPLQAPKRRVMVPAPTAAPVVTCGDDTDWRHRQLVHIQAETGGIRCRGSRHGGGAGIGRGGRTGTPHGWS